MSSRNLAFTFYLLPLHMCFSRLHRDRGKMRLFPTAWNVNLYRFLNGNVGVALLWFLLAFYFRSGSLQIWPKKFVLGCVISPLRQHAESRNLQGHTFFANSLHALEK